MPDLSRVGIWKSCGPGAVYLSEVGILGVVGRADQTILQGRDGRARTGVFGAKRVW